MTDQPADKALAQFFQGLDERLDHMEGMIAALVDFTGSRLLAAAIDPAPFPEQDDAQAWDVAAFQRQLTGLRKAAAGFGVGAFADGYRAITDKLASAEEVVQKLPPVRRRR